MRFKTILNLSILMNLLCLMIKERTYASVQEILEA